jgi:hypothetical protein
MIAEVKRLVRVRRGLEFIVASHFKPNYSRVTALVWFTATGAITGVEPMIADFEAADSVKA